jgi:hypothetical protein
MSMAINFRGGETTGSVSDRRTDTSRQETAGGVGARRIQNSIFITDEPKCDTVCFRGEEYTYAEPKKKTSTTGIVLGTVAAAAVVAGLLGLAHKYNTAGKAIEKVESERIKNFLRSTDKITEPCYKACKWIKNNSYDKVVKFLNKK